jgi:chemotaxis-related protein WspD
MMAPIDDCWNRIGVMGDGSCAELSHHTHCRNCPVYSAAARRLLDVPPPMGERESWTQRYAQDAVTTNRNLGRALLIFRSAQEWFALTASVCVEVASVRPVRTLPHRRDPAVMGLANIRGELMVCVSLAAFLRLPQGANTTTPRLIVLKGAGEPTAIQVDEVAGTHRYTESELRPVPDTLAASASRNAEAVARWRDRTVGVLNAEALLASLDRCIA